MTKVLNSKVNSNRGKLKKKTDKNSISHLIRKLLGSNEIFAVYVTIISFPRT